MVDVWPATLPQHFLQDGYSEGVADGRLVSQMEAGPAKVRRRSSAMPRPLTGRMLMDDDQLDDLRGFVDATLIGGSLPFTFPNPTDFGATGILVRFASALPRWSWRGPDAWDVSIDLEVLS